MDVASERAVNEEVLGVFTETAIHTFKSATAPLQLNTQNQNIMCLIHLFALTVKTWCLPTSTKIILPRNKVDRSSESEPKQ